MQDILCHDYSMMASDSDVCSNFGIFESIMERDTLNISKNITDNITEEQIRDYLKNIYENTDFKKYEEQKYYLELYFLAVYLTALKKDILCGKVAASERYSDFLNNIKDIKITWFDKLKLKMTGDIFFDYLKDKYYYFEPDKVIKRKYYKDRLKFYQFAEKFLFFNKYRAFAVMQQDYFYNTKRYAKYHLRIAGRSLNGGSQYIGVKLIIVHFLAALIAYWYTYISSRSR